MLTISGTNVNEIFPLGILYLKETGELRDSRNGPTLEIDRPVAVTYQFPQERVLFSAERDANPFFHLFESMWMLAGRDDVAFLDQYNSLMKQYSDDGLGFNAAYGHRLRKGFGFDQLDEIIQRLRKNSDDRRAVLQIWDPADLHKESKDYACNLVITPRIRKNKLDWTVFNRSNDYVYGMLGANVVHMSIIHEYVANMIGVMVGSYTQITNCLHAYVENPAWQRIKDLPVTAYDPYNTGAVRPFNKLVTNKESWHNDLQRWMDCPWGDYQYDDPFFTHVLKPMAIAHKAHKENKDGRRYTRAIKASDWKLACEQWLERREEPI